MNKIRPILYLLLSVLGIIVLYNYIIAPMLMQNNYHMGMGMHERMYNNYYYLIDDRYVLVIVIIIAGLILYELLKPGNKDNRCSKCGHKIENERWKICPLCGTPIKQKR